MYSYIVFIYYEYFRWIRNKDLLYAKGLLITTQVMHLYLVIALLRYFDIETISYIHEDYRLMSIVVLPVSYTILYFNKKRIKRIIRKYYHTEHLRLKIILTIILCFVLPIFLFGYISYLNGLDFPR